MVISSTHAWSSSLPNSLRGLDIAARIHTDPEATAFASTDFGNLTTTFPAAVLHPTSPSDIAALVRASYSSSRPFPVSARGRGHSLSGQAFAAGGVVIDMPSLGHVRGVARINVSSENLYVDAGGEQLWVDVLHAALEHGLSPRSWTDYLHLTVGGTLSNAGISGQTFRHGPQISNVYELDVIIGKGEIMTCSKDKNPDLFDAVLGGLGQFGVITRARIALEPAPMMVRWVRFMYTDFDTLTSDQERLITEDDVLFGLVDYMEGSVLTSRSLIGNWRSPPPSTFFSERDMAGVSALAKQQETGALYCLEGALYYNEASVTLVDEKLRLLLEDLNFAPGFAFTQDVSYVDFLDRVHDGEKKLRSAGLWDVPHPWLNLFVPKSRVLDFDTEVFKGVFKHNKAMGPVLIYPMNKNKWDQNMSAVIPDEDIFYTIGILRSAVTDDDLENLRQQNEKIMRFCEEAGISFKQYLPHYESRADWMKHFGRKWSKFVEMKMKYDPKAILSRGQKIFTSSLEGHHVF